MTSWRLYGKRPSVYPIFQPHTLPTDSIYTERYLSLPSANPSGYETASITNVTGFRNLDFSLAHGSADDNVHFANTMRLVDITTFVAAPIGWRDPEQATIARRLLMLREKHLRVDLQLLLRDTGLLITLTDVERRMKRGKQGGAAADSMLMQLERLHKILSAYVWLALRQPVQFCSAGEAEQLKHRVEAAMEWVLHALTWKGSEVADRARQVLDQRPVKQLSYEPHRMVRAFRDGLGAGSSTKEGRPAGRA